jgi:uncharacterized membrane protein YoaK (UPF0700 family)
VRDALLLLLAATSGYVDAVSYLGLGHVFMANMTGNTVLLGLELVQGHGTAALRSAVALAGFVAGVALGSAIADREGERGLWPVRVTAACAIEGLILLALSIGGAHIHLAAGDPAILVLIAFAALALGLQSAAVRTLGIVGVTTTYITGTWTSMVAGLISQLRRALRPHTSGGRTVAPQHGVGLQAAVLAVYLVAAMAGGAAEIAWQWNAMLLPTMAVGLVVALAALRFHHRRRQ